MPTLFAIALAALAAYVGKLLSDGDRIARNIGAGARWRRWLIASVEQGSIPEEIGSFLLAILHEIDICRKDRVTILPIAFFYLAGDALACLAAPGDRGAVDELSFSDWIAKFLDPDTGEYCYPAAKLYVARSKMLEGARTRDDHDMKDESLGVTYSFAGNHVLSSDPLREVRIVSIPALMRDLEISIKRFVEALQTDGLTLSRTVSRWPIAGGLGSLIKRSNQIDRSTAGALNIGHVSDPR